MRRRTLTAIVSLVIATLLLCPVSEMFDRWDHTAKTGKDTESSLMLVAECFGAAIAVLHAASAWLPSLATAPAVAAFPGAAPRFDRLVNATFGFPESPPALPLRI